MTNQDERALLDGLRALRQESAEERAGPHIEAAILREFRARGLRPKRRSYRWAGVAAALAAAACVLIALAWPSKLRTQGWGKRPSQPRLAAVRTPERVVTTHPRAPKPLSSRPRRHREVALAARPTEGSEPAAETGFLTFPEAPPLAPNDQFALVRVELPRTSLRAFGLPYNEDRASDRISADVLLGQDGLVRAVRFLH